MQDETVYAPGTQKKVIGEVIRWNKTSGPETMDAVKYIELLEAEIEELKSQVIRKTANGQNDLLDFLKTLEPQNLKVRMCLWANSLYNSFLASLWIFLCSIASLLKPLTLSTCHICCHLVFI